MFVAGTHIGSFLLALLSIAVSAKMSPIMNFANDGIRMDHPRILQKEELCSCSCMMKGKTIILLQEKTKVMNILKNPELYLKNLFDYVGKPINPD